MTQKSNIQLCLFPAHLGKPLETYIAGVPKARVLRTPTWGGLIQARLLGARHAQGTVLTFLDSHCECFPGKQGLYSISGKTSYRQFSWSFEATRLDVMIIYRSEIWQASRQSCCRGAWQISEPLGKSKLESLVFENSRNLAVRRPSAK